MKLNMSLIFKFSLVAVICSIIPACTTIKQTNNLSKQKNVNVSVSLAMDYLTGTRVEKNPDKAFYLLRSAAQQGDSAAASTLGYLYASGIGVRQDYSAALSWYRQAADSGHGGASYNLGLMYSYGLGAPIDQLQAQHYFAQAKMLGFP